MPPRGRPRKPSKSIPAHIDQAALPAGMYFNPLGRGRWYVLEGRKKRYVAGADAKLSELHRIVEDAAKSGTSTVAWLCEQFEASPQFKDLAKATRADYSYCAVVICEFKLLNGTTFGAIDARALTRPALQRLVDAIAKGTKRGTAGALIPTPSKACHVGRFLAVLTRWGANRDHCPAGIADKLDLPREKRDARMPESDAHDAVIAFAKIQGVGTRGKQDSVAAYLWAVAEIAYLCRLRGVEVCDMTDASAEPAGLRCIRRKGSDTNITEWTPRLRAAWDYLIAYRDAIWEKRRHPVQIRPADRPLLISLTGSKLTRRALSVSWGRMVDLAIEKGILTQAQKFGLHGLKHRGITDTEGTRADKREASGHKTEAMVSRYDHSVPLVPAAGQILGKNRDKPQQ